MSAQLIEALNWYAEQTRLCRLIHAEGDAGRQALAADGGAKARAALAAAEAQSVAIVPVNLSSGEQQTLQKALFKSVKFVDGLAQAAADSEADAFERGRQQGMKQERALWVLASEGQALEPDTFAQPVAVPQGGPPTSN